MSEISLVSGERVDTWG